MLSPTELKWLLDYNPETGEFRWRTPRARAKVKSGEITGSIYKNGYRYIEVDGERFRACRLAWYYVHGYFPVSQIEHKDRNKSNDRLENLRLANDSLNQANRGLMITNISGIKGVHFESARNKWVAAITVNGHKRNLGRFVTKEEAATAYHNAAITAWGTFAKTSLTDDLLSPQIVDKL